MLKVRMKSYWIVPLFFILNNVDAIQCLQPYCPNPYDVKFTAKKYSDNQPVMGVIEGVGSAAAKQIHFKNPYMRSKKSNPAYVPTPVLDEHGYFEENYIDPGRPPYYMEGHLYCYYLYPIEKDRSLVERLILVSDMNSFHQCADKQVLPSNQVCH